MDTKLLDATYDFLLRALDDSLWRAAHWDAMAFYGADGLPGPIAALVFKNVDAGKEAFLNLQTRIGRSDEFGLLDVTIIEGREGYPHAYALKLEPNIVNACNHFGVEFNEGERVPIASIWRFKWMKPQGPSTGLEVFKRDYLTTKRFLLAPASLGGQGVQVHPAFGVELLRLKVMTLEEYQAANPKADILAE